MNNNAHRLSDIFLSIAKAALILGVVVNLTACGGEGPFGNNQGPKRPAYSAGPNALN